MSENAQPSINPSNDDSLLGTFKLVLSKFLQGVDDMLPATVISFDRTANRAYVQPQIMMVTTENEKVRRAPVISIPVFQIGGGGVILNFNLNPGDLGWIKANDRDISLFMQSFKESAPNTFRKHSFEDALFFPDPMHLYTINSEDAENCVLQTLDGSQRVAIWSNKVKITSNNEIVLDAPNIRITGDLSVDGDVIGDADGDTISLNTHTHGGVEPGGGNTGQPNT